MLVLILNASSNAHVDIYSGARGLNFGQSLHLHVHFVSQCAQAVRLVESAHICALAWAIFSH